MSAGLAFDQLAAKYDASWSNAPIGRLQREAVWRSIDPLFMPGDRILDLGCGTGVDAIHFLERGIDVCGIDASREMVHIARERGVDARRLQIEALQDLSGQFGGAISNFGPLNCVADLDAVGRAASRLIRPGGYLAICMMSCCCAWEFFYYALRLNPHKAFRRWHRAGSRSSIGVRVYYPSLRRMVRAFDPGFRLIRWRGIGLCVPPSYVGGLSDHDVIRLDRADRHLAHLPGLRTLADHRLLIFQRRAL